MGSNGPKESYVRCEVLRDVAMATNSGTQFVVIGFMALDEL